MVNRSSRSRFTDYRKKLASGSRRRGGSAVGGQQKAKSVEPRNFRQLLFAFLGLLQGHRQTVAFALGTLTIATVLKLVPPAAIKLVIDYVIVDRPLPEAWSRWLPTGTDRLSILLAIAAGVVVVSFAASVIHLSGRWYATKSVNRVQVAIRKRVFEHAVRLPLHRVYQLKSGGAASLLREDAGGVSELIFSMLYNPWRAIIQLTGSLIVLAWVDWRMMIGGAILAPIVYVTHQTWIKRIRPMYRDLRAQRQEIDGQTTEAFGGMRVVRAFTRERSEAARFVRNNNLLIRKQLFVWWWSRVVDLLWELLIPLASTCLLAYGGYRILQGDMTLGDLTMFLFYLAMLLEPLATLANSATSFQNNLAGLDRVLDLLDEESELKSQPNAVAVNRDQVVGRLAFCNVSFHYPGSEQLVLDDVTFEAHSGETIALVGRSGAGKTTLCNLVARFYDPTDGSLELDGVGLREIELDSYRSLLGIVEQDVFLFDGTIAENIAYAVARPEQAAVEEAARAANAHDFIVSLEHGYDTVIGERGVKLSGGQRQRLAIARALLADPRILILDEATSNLDTESERLIQQSLSVLQKDRTCFVIAHRLSTIQHADKIVVLDNGRVIEIGSHDELMSRSGKYQKMVEMQTEVEPAAR